MGNVVTHQKPFIIQEKSLYPRVGVKASCLADLLSSFEKYTVGQTFTYFRTVSLATVEMEPVYHFDAKNIGDATHVLLTDNSCRVLSIMNLLDKYHDSFVFWDIVCNKLSRPPPKRTISFFLQRKPTDTERRVSSAFVNES